MYALHFLDGIDTCTAYVTGKKCTILAETVIHLLRIHVCNGVEVVLSIVCDFHEVYIIFLRLSVEHLPAHICILLYTTIYASAVTCIVWITYYVTYFTYTQTYCTVHIPCNYQDVLHSTHTLQLPRCIA